MQHNILRTKEREASVVKQVSVFRKCVGVIARWVVLMTRVTLLMAVAVGNVKPAVQIAVQFPCVPAAVCCP